MSRNLVTDNCLFVLALQISLFRRSINDRKKLLELHLIGLYFHSFSTLKKYANPAQIKDIENTTFFDLGGNSFVLTSIQSLDLIRRLQIHRVNYISFNDIFSSL